MPVPLVSMSPNIILCILGLLSTHCCVHGEIYVYRNSVFNGIAGLYQDCQARQGPGPESGIVGLLQPGEPMDGCSDLIPATKNQLYVILATGNCSHETKVRHAQSAGYDAVIVHNVRSNELIVMVYDNNTGIEIPAVFVSEEAGLALLHAATIPRTFVIINELHINGRLVLLILILVGLGAFLVLLVLLGSAWVRYIWSLWQSDALNAPLLNSLPKQKYNTHLNYDTCVICQAHFKERDMLRILPCAHAYHVKCIDAWLTEYKRECPVCKRPIRGPGEEESGPEDMNDRTPLLRNQTSSLYQLGERSWTRSYVQENGSSGSNISPQAVVLVYGNGTPSRAAGEESPHHGSLENIVHVSKKTLRDKKKKIPQPARRTNISPQVDLVYDNGTPLGAQEESLHRSFENTDFHVDMCDIFSKETPGPSR